MELKLVNSTVELSGLLIMGIIDLTTDDPLDLDEIAEIASGYAASGATFVELSVNKHKRDACSQDAEIDMLCAALETIKDIELIPAVYTSDPVIMRKVVECGAQMIVDPLALTQPGALEAVAEIKCAVCMLMDQSVNFTEDDCCDPCATVSEFFYERLDACINAHIDRQRIVLDPMISIDTSVDFRLKMFGRLNTFNSFGLPISCALPRMVAEKDNVNQSMSIVATVAIFAEQQGVRMIRTNRVYDIALVINSWHALNHSARPFKLSRAIGRRLKELALGRLKKNENK